MKAKSEFALEALRAACTHRRVRVLDYDDAHLWHAQCEDCGSSRELTHAEWRQRLLRDETPDPGIGIV